MKRPSKIKRAAVAGVFHTIQFLCWVAIWLLVILFVFGLLVMGLGGWQRYE
jgi:hypothetical protein